MRILMGLTLLLAGHVALAAPSCTVIASSLSFGGYGHQDVLPTDSQNTVTVECEEDTILSLATPVNYTIALGPGTAGSFASRQMGSGAHTLNYNLYTDLLRTTVWGDGTGGSVTVPGFLSVPGCVLILGCTPVSAVSVVYGRIPAGQIVPAGSYADSILVTVTY